MRILILGATGQIGSQIYKGLKSNPEHNITGTSRKSKNGFLKFDPFSDQWSLLGKADVLINCIGQIEETKEMSFDKVHRQLTFHILENRVLLGNPRIIQLSVLGASPNSPIDFLKTKGIADEYLTQFLNTIVVRASIVCTHQTMLVKKMRMLENISRFSGGLTLVPKGFPDRKIQPVMVGDLAAIVSTLCVADYSSSILNVVGPHPISYRQLIELMFQVQGKKAILVNVPRALTDFVVKRFIAPCFPSLINTQQYHLLFQDNVAEKTESEKYLGRPLASTIDFWRNEFN